MKVSLETAARYAKYLNLEVDLEEYRARMEKALETTETVLQAAKEAAR